VVSTIALAVGLVVVNVVQPGAGLHIAADPAGAAAISACTPPQAQMSTADFLLHIVPDTAGARVIGQAAGGGHVGHVGERQRTGTAADHAEPCFQATRRHIYRDETRGRSR
jgi:hypothetical protein